MNRNAQTLVEQGGSYTHLFDRVSAGGRFEALPSDGAIRLLSDQELLAAAGSVSQLIRLAEAERAELAGEMAGRSEPKDDTSLARRMGAGTVGNLVSQVTGVPRSQAGTVVASGEAFRPPEPRHRRGPSRGLPADRRRVRRRAPRPRDRGRDAACARQSRTWARPL